MGDLILASDFVADAAVSGGAVPVLIEMVQSTDAGLCLHALFAITNLAGNNTQYRDVFLASNVFGGLRGLLTRFPTSATMAYELSWAVSNLCHGKPAPPLDVLLPALPILNDLFDSQPRHDTLANVFHAFASITDKSDVARIEAVRRLGVLPRIIQCLYATESPDLQQNALKVVGHFSAGNDLHVQLLLHQKVEEALAMLLRHPNAVVQADACWTLSNLLTAPADSVQHLLDVVPSLIPLATSSSGEKKVRKQALWAVANAVSAATPAQLPRLIAQDVLSVFCAVLRDVENDNDVDEQMVSLALEGVDILLTKLQQPPVNDDEALFATVRTRLSDPENGIVLDLTDLIQYCEVVELQQRAARLWLRYFVFLSLTITCNVPITDEKVT